MCFYYDDGDRTLAQDRVTARKPHACTNWSCREPIAKGDQYERVAWLANGTVHTEKYCERCLYYLALIYAQERSEGCASHEAWCPIEEIYQHMRDLGWKLPSDRAST